MLRDADFLVVHDLLLDHATNGRGPVVGVTRRESETLRLVHEGRLSSERPPLLSEVIALIGAHSMPTLMELDLKEVEPMPWKRVEELARLVEPVKDRVIFGGIADWNLRRLLHVDGGLAVGFNPAAYLDWEPEGDSEGGHLPRGAYGYLDAHPLARRRHTSVADYLYDRLGGILHLVPGAREVHLRLAAFERMLEDGMDDAAEVFHRHGLALDVWTLDAGTPRWHERLARALAAGVDIITTNTARALAAAGHQAPVPPSAN
jgi:glycerophosphoryl diester phosphodiesterase